MARSGTTWIGKMLSAGGGATYVSEPLNSVRPGIFRLRVGRDYTYLHSGNEAQFLPVFQDVVRLRLRVLAELKAVRAAGDVGRVAIRGAQFARGRIRRRRVLLKDPYAVFSAEWFADRLGCRVVVVVRNPGAVVSSLKRLNWRAPLADLSAQPELVHDWLQPYSDDLRAAQEEARLRRDVVWSNSVLWRIIYATVARHAERRLDFLIVRHEDVARHPRDQFERLYRKLDLSFNAHAAAAVDAASGSANPAELPVEKPHSVQLDSQASLRNWRRRLTTEEIRRIRSLTEPVASRWYPDNGWGI
jgi:hypothetical protein